MAHGRGVRQRKEWAALASATNAFTGNSTFLGGILNFTAAITVLRMVGTYTIGPTSATAALDEAHIAVAIGVVSSDAAAVGAGSLPDPEDEPEYPWLYWMHHNFFYPAVSTDAGGATLSGRFAFDSRSMRKIKPRESLVFLAQYQDVVGTPPLQISIGATRVLIGTS